MLTQKEGSCLGLVSMFVSVFVSVRLHLLHIPKVRYGFSVTGQRGILYSLHIKRLHLGGSCIGQSQRKL